MKFRSDQTEEKSETTKMVKSDENSAVRRKACVNSKPQKAIKKPKKKAKPAGTSNQICNFAIRWSIPKDQDKDWALEMRPKFQELLEYSLGADKWLYQLEDSWLEKSEDEKLEIQKEHPETSHNLHYQGYVHIEKKVRTSTLFKKVNEIEMFKGMYIAPASNNGIYALRNYCIKPKSRVDGPWADQEVYLGADLITPNQMTPAQKNLLQYLLTQDPNSSHRKILWIHDPLGGAGKSAFKKYCQFHYKWKGFSYATAKDILFLVAKFPNQRVYFFNLSKTRSKDVSEEELYAALESIKDGDFISTKYEPKTVLMNRCHVVVFANHVPNDKRLTRGRIEIITWKPLPRELIEDKIEWDFNVEGAEVMTAEKWAEESRKLYGKNDPKPVTLHFDG